MRGAYCAHYAVRYDCAYRAGDNKYRAATASVGLADLCRHPFLPEETLLAEIVIEHLREFYTGVAQNIVVNVICHYLFLKEQSDFVDYVHCIEILRCYFVI